MRNVRSLIAAIAVLSLAACGEPLETEIVGVWHGTNPRQSLDFNPSGRVVLQDHKLDRMHYGRYEIDGRRVSMQFESFSRPVVREAEIEGNSLTLYRDTGPPELLRRQPP